MIMHLVFFKWQNDVPPEAINQLMEALQDLKYEIPEIQELSYGENFSELSQGFQFGLAVQFSDRMALNTYMTHPLHQEIIEQLITPILQDILVVDYEVN